MKKIAIIGGTGMIGKPVTEQLVKAGFDITLLAKNVQKARALFPGLTVIETDVFNKRQLLIGLKNQDCVYISVSPDRTARPSDRMQEKEGIDNIIDAAKDCGVKRIALLSSLVQDYDGTNGFDWWIFQLKLDAVQKIKSCGIPYSIFYPSSFMETVNRDLINGSKLLLTAGSSAPMWFIAGEDYGKQVARAFQIAGNNNQEYTIQGPEPYTWNEASSIIVANYRKPLKIMKAPLLLLKIAGIFSRKMNYASRICEALNKYPEKFSSEAAWEELGKPTITLANYIKTL
ncbi:MAG: SDR family oxidoreductase [Chitinophagaceae bacterium]